MKDESSIQPLLRKLCEDRVNQDNSQFGICSIYLPNPVFTDTPEYCLIAMEPSLGGMSPEMFHEWVNRGFLNFLYSEGDFILHYCAYTFLCNGSFGYHITDISKGAMKTEVANSQRTKRYGNWLGILKQELMFFKCPRRIAIGSHARDFLTKNNFSLVSSVIHYSQNNSARFRDYYAKHPDQTLTTIHIKLREFATGLLNDLNYDSSLKHSILKKLFNNELSIWKKGLFLMYMDRFSAARS